MLYLGCFLPTGHWGGHRVLKGWRVRKGGAVLSWGLGAMTTFKDSHSTLVGNHYLKLIIHPVKNACCTFTQKLFLQEVFLSVFLP